MANYKEPEPGMEERYLEWCASRPEHVRVVAERFRPWKLYRNSGCGNRCIPLSFGEEENGTVTVRVAIVADYNALLFERQVFGINPDHLTECELPTADEPVGALMSQDDVDANMDVLRAFATADRAQRN